MRYYYIRNEGYLGNALMWWGRKGGCTCDIKEAEPFTEEEARAVCKRPQDSAYLSSYIDNLFEGQKLIIDSQYVDPTQRLWEKDY